MSKLNPQQLEAVKHIEGPLLIMAGAGSGKTTVLVNRIVEMLERGVRSHNILAITFTNKAAKELKERITKKVGIEKSSEIWASTFHSMCVRILKREVKHLMDFDRNFTIYDPSDVENVLKMILQELGLDIKKMKPKYFQNIISTLKNEMLDSDALKNESDNPFIDWKKSDTIIDKTIPKQEKTLFVKIYKMYEERMKTFNAMDFDDLILNVIKLFYRNKNILEKYQRVFKYIMIDEYQDTNYSQYVLVNLVAKTGSRNLAVVGDEDQSIYKFRGSDKRGIKSFEEDYKEAKIIKLEENYRSTKTILQAANEVISNNTNRMSKNLFTSNVEGEKITNVCLYDQHDEARYVVKEIKKRKIKGNKLSDFTILFRTNSQSRPLEEIFIQERIPYKIFGGLKFFDRKEIKDVVAYLKFIFNPSDLLSFKRIINLPKRGIGPKTIDLILEKSKETSIIKVLKELDGIKVTKKARENIDKFVELFENYQEKSQYMKVDDFINDLLEEIKFLDYLDSIKDENKSERKINVSELVNMASEMVIANKDAKLENFLEHVSLYSDTEEIDEENAVKIMTVHASKGLEFPVVFIVGLEENIFPHERSINESEEEVEEERRLFYVAVTRAEEKLYLTNAETRRVFGNLETNEPSRFLSEFSFSLLEK